MACTLAAGGIREDVVAVLMGHKRAGTTALYSHLFRDAYEGVEEALEAVLGVHETSTVRRVTTGHSLRRQEPAPGENSPLAGISST
jgi:hypothetical protein